MTVETPVKTSFTEINLSELEKKKVPKRLVYFSDGVLEEYSSDEEAIDAVNSDTQPLVDPKTLPWVPYFGYLIWWVGSRTLAVCDYLGEHLAWFLGITSPKFQYELEQFEKLAKEEEELENYMKAENAGWSLAESGNVTTNVIKLQPKVASESSIEVKINDFEKNTKISKDTNPIADL